MKQKLPRWQKSLFALFSQKTRLAGKQTMANKKTAKNNSYDKLFQTILELENKQKKQQQNGTNMTLKSINNTNDELELKNWCHKYFNKHGEACFTDVLVDETGSKYSGYTKNSMQAVMRKVWNELNAPKPKRGAKKRASPVSVMTAPDLTAIARSGAQLKDDHEDIGDEEGMNVYYRLFVIVCIASNPFLLHRGDDGIGHQTTSFG